MPPKTSGVAETILYVADVARTARWYERVFGLEAIFEQGERLRALQVSPGRVLLLFKEGATTEPVVLPGGTIPPHDGSGPAHIAFAMDPQDTEQWERHLADNGVLIEGRVQWSPDAVSLYFRDPDRHLVELISSQYWIGVAAQRRQTVQE